MSKAVRPRREAVRQDAAEERILAARSVRMRFLVADAKDLALIQESRHFEIRRCGTLRDYAERILSVSAAEAMETAAIGRALRVFPELEPMLLDARTTPEAVAALAPLGKREGLVRPEDQWLVWVETESAKAVRRRVEKRMQEVKEAPATRALTIHFAPQALSDLEKARELASRKEHEPVDRSEAVAVALRDFVRRRDLTERTPGKRRMGPTDAPDAPKSRTIACNVERKVIERADGKCRLPFCDCNLFVEKVHAFAKHRHGGSREADNLDLHCTGHHRLQEDGRIRNLGTTETPRFVDDAGVPLDVRWQVWVRSQRNGRSGPDVPTHDPPT